MFEAPLTVLCCPEVAAQLHSPADLLQHTLLRSYRADEWPLWFQAAGLPAHAPLTRSIVFDTSLAMLEAARQGVGVALAPAAMFARQLASESIRRPFATEVSTGSYWLTRLQSRGRPARCWRSGSGCWRGLPLRRGGDNGYAGDSSVDEEVITFLAPFFIRSGSPKVDTV